MQKLLKSSGGAKKGEKYYILNGWRVKFSTQGVYWHTIYDELEKAMLGTGEKFSEKSGKPFTSKTDFTKKKAARFVEILSSKKSPALLRKENKAAKKEKKIRASRSPKRAWCDGCELCPQGVESVVCDNMKYSESIGHHYCKEDKFYEGYWCKNAKLVRTKGQKKWHRKFICKITKGECTFQKESITKGIYGISYNTFGEHFTTCPKYIGKKISIYY